jgi:hypothetical protein
MINPLFYWTLRERTRASFTSNHTTAHTATGSHSRSTSGATSRRSSAPSVLTDNVGIVSHGTIGSAKVKAEPDPDAEMIIVNSDGGPSDRDETNHGLKERLAAVNSPLKGRKRVSREVSLRSVTSVVASFSPLSPIQHLVGVAHKKTYKRARSEARSEELPEYVTPKWFRFTFVSTYMTFISQTADPWDVPIKQALEVMQKIWNATCAHEYEITASTMVYQKVCDWFGFRTILIYIFRRFNAARTRGEISSGPPASHPFWPISTPEMTCKIQMKTVKCLPKVS